MQPEAPLSAPAVSNEPHPINPQIRVLLVDDTEDVVELLGECLERQGYVTQGARDSRSALRIAESFAPQVALLDIGLPIVDGYQLARQLRTVPGLSTVLLVALTGHDGEEARRRVAEAGFHEHLVKPIQIEKLSEVLKRLTCAAQPKESQTEAAAL